MNKLLNTLKSLLRRNFCDLSCLIFFSSWKGRMFVLSLCFVQDQENKKKKTTQNNKAQGWHLWDCLGRFYQFEYSMNS